MKLYYVCFFNDSQSSYKRVGDRHSKDYCAMYDICGERSDGKVLNCPYGSPSVEVRANVINFIISSSDLIFMNFF